MHYKLRADNGHIHKSYDIIELWMFVVSNRKWSYKFYVDYEELPTELFLKLYLNKTKNFRQYYELHRILTNPITRKQWLRKKHIRK